MCDLYFMCYMFDAEVNGIACLKCGPVQHLSECTIFQECDATEVCLKDI